MVFRDAQGQWKDMYGRPLAPTAPEPKPKRTKAYVGLGALAVIVLWPSVAIAVIFWLIFIWAVLGHIVRSFFQ